MGDYYMVDDPATGHVFVMRNGKTVHESSSIDEAYEWLSWQTGDVRFP